jgi:hypothetical protein
MNKCYDAFSEPTLYSFRYGYKALAHSRGHDANWGIGCIMHLSILMNRQRWVEQVEEGTSAQDLVPLVGESLANRVAQLANDPTSRSTDARTAQRSAREMTYDDYVDAFPE